MKNIQKTRDWLHMALKEFDAALADYKEERNSGSIQHAQQCVERIGKSILSFLGFSPEKTHHPSNYIVKEILQNPDVIKYWRLKNMLKNMELIKQKEYCIPIEEYFEIVAKKVDVYAVLLFGSVARGNAKPFRSYESDIDIIVVINDIPLDLGKRMLYKIDVESGTQSRVQAIWMTPKELEEHIEAKSDYILEAFESGIILFDPEGFIQQKKSDLFMELKTKGVSRLKWGWSWNIKAGEVVEM